MPLRLRLAGELIVRLIFGSKRIGLRVLRGKGANRPVHSLSQGVFAPLQIFQVGLNRLVSILREDVRQQLPITVPNPGLAGLRTGGQHFTCHVFMAAGKQAEHRKVFAAQIERRVFRNSVMQNFP